MGSGRLFIQAIEQGIETVPCLVRSVRKDGEEAGAVYSLPVANVSKYRYVLWRIWDYTLPVWLYCMLNPSTATELKLDPTLKRQRQRAINGGAGGMVVTNSGAIRETKSKIAIRDIDPIGPYNEWWIRHIAPTCDMHIAGWGPMAKKFGGDQLVARALGEAGVQLHRLELSKGGFPKHPLYTSYAVQPTPFYL
jgi:hypothetical protein